MQTCKTQFCRIDKFDLFLYTVFAITGFYSTSFIDPIVWEEVMTIGQQQDITIEKRAYTVQEVMKILNIGRTKAYEVCNSGSFRTIKIGRVLRINKASFDEWFNNTT